MNTPFTNWTPNTTFNATPSWSGNTGTPFGLQGWTPSFQQTWNNGWNQNGLNGFANSPFGFYGYNSFPSPQNFWNQNTPWNHNAGWNPSTGWSQPSPFSGTPFNGYGQGGNGWWFGNSAPFGTPFSGTGFGQFWNTGNSSFFPQTSFHNGFQNGFQNNWGSATTPWFSNTFPGFSSHSTTWNGNGWQPFGTWFNTPNTQTTFATSFGSTPWNTTGFGWNAPTGINTNTAQNFTPSFTPGFATTSGQNFTPSYTPNFTPGFTPSNGTWHQPMPSYTGTPENFASNTGSYTQNPVNCNGRDAA